jgi:uncharacterized protein YqeY
MEEDSMSLRERFTAELRTSMKAGNTARTSTLRLILAKLKDTEIAARPKDLGDDEIQAMLRGMVKSRRDSITLYLQGNRPELAAKEEAEIGVIESFLPQPMGDVEMAAAVDAAVAETGASSPKDMGRVMGALRTRHGAALDLGRAGPLVKARLDRPSGG